MWKYNRILGLILQQNSKNHGKASTSLQLSLSVMLTHVNFPTFAMADPHYGGMIRVPVGFETLQPYMYIKQTWQHKTTVSQHQNIICNEQ